MADMLNGLLPPVSGSFIGWESDKVTTGTIAASLPAVAASFSGTAGVAPTWTLPAVTGSFTGVTGSASSSLAPSLPALTASFSGTTGTIGSLAATLPAVRSAFEGPHVLDAALPAVRGSFTGVVGIVGNVAAILPSLTASIAGNVTHIADLDGRLPPITANFTGLAGIAGTLSAPLGAIAATVNAVTGIAGTLAANLPAISADFTAHQAVTGAMRANLPAIHAAFFAITQAQASTAIALNMIGKQPSMLEGFDFNSLAFFNGQWVGAAAGGIYRLSDQASDEDGQNIAGVMRTGTTDFGTPARKGLTDVWLGCRANGALTLRVYLHGDATEFYDYTVEAAHDGLRNVRVQLGRGLDAAYMQFELRNEDGCYFDVDRAEFLPIEKPRRHGG